VVEELEILNLWVQRLEQVDLVVVEQVVIIQQELELVFLVQQIPVVAEAVVAELVVVALEVQVVLEW
jgi:hypothetical protein